MATTPKAILVPKWLIDLHGVREALQGRSNAKARVIDAIQSGEMLVMRSVQDELKSAYPNLWSAFVAIKPKTYLDTPMQVYPLADQLQETHGSSILGGIPDFAHFEAVALARVQQLKLISAGKGLNDCQDIATKCGLPADQVGGISTL